MSYIPKEDDRCPGCGYQETHTRSWWTKDDPMVTIIAFWPVEESSGDLAGYADHPISRGYLRTSCAQAHYCLQIITTPDQAVIPFNIPVIGVEEPYTIMDTERHGITTNINPVKEMADMLSFDHPTDATYIVGNTYYQRPSDHFDIDISLGLTMNDNDIANYSPLYGAQLVPIIWYDRMVKSLNKTNNSESI